MRVAINGFGRVGRCVFRAAYERGLLAGVGGHPRIEFVAINELADTKTIAYLTQYDSTHGRFPAQVESHTGGLRLLSKGANAASALHDGDIQIDLLSEPKNTRLPWQQLDIDWVLECTGEVTTKEQASAHIAAGAKRVLLSNPGEADIPAVVFGVNHSKIWNVSAGDSTAPSIISAASCTSNALIPTLSALHDALGISDGVITTIHAAMHDQPVLDAYHGDDLRKNRASSASFIPVSTELAAGIGRVIPSLAGRFVAQAIRVPVQNVSALNVTLNLETATDANEVNAILRRAGDNYPEHVLAVTEEPLTSCDFIHQPCSGTVDAKQTQVVNAKTVNLLIWFDNEWAFANRMLDVLLCSSAPG